MNIFITGADGFIGSHLTEECVKRGYKVKALSYYNSFSSYGWLDFIDPKIKKELQIISGDIRDYQLIERCINKNDIILHLASLISIPYSYVSPDSYVQTNIVGTSNLLNTAIKKGVRQFIHTSTSEVYGSAIYTPIDEKHPLQAQSPYSASKIGADHLALSYYNSFDLPLKIIRPFNTFGPRQSARAFIPTVITQILNKKKILNLGSLHPKRDFTYIDDTVSAYLKAIKQNFNYGDIYNLGTNCDFSMKEVLDIISSKMGKNIKSKRDKKRIRPKKSEVDRLISNNELAIKKLKWKPNFVRIKGFQKGIEKTIEWFSNKDNLKIYKSNQYNI